LLIPGANSHTCKSELKHVSDWAESNNLELNQSKSLEIIVITAPGVRGADTRANPPSTIQDIERVNKLTVRGVVINDRLSADNHVTATIAACSKSLYALRVLRTHGMPTLALHSVYTKQLWCQS